MQTIASGSQIEQEIKRSRFIGFLEPVDTEFAARDFIDQIRRRFPDARHHCTAFVVRTPNALPITRSSDDGEPAGTAGMPILTTLLGHDLVDVCAVVVRYFGGIKLGTGGLVRAYTSSVQQAIEAATLVPLVEKTFAHLECDLASAGFIESALRSADVEITEIRYQENVVFTLRYDPCDQVKLNTLVAEITKGKGTLQVLGKTVAPQN